MKNKKKAFTLVELLAVVAIAAILLMIATDRFIGDSFRANATYNQRVDVQTGVKTSMDNVKSILKRSVQVHLVGKEVYKEDMDLSKLDNKYNYIGFRYDENGNRFLANIVYDKNENKFNVLPLTAGDKKDIMTGDKINYNLEFYKNDNNYKDKLDKDIISLTITGKSSANVVGQGIQDEYVLKEDIQLPNVNQILLSRHLQGGVDKITALAYDNGIIEPGKSVGKFGVVMVLDSSGSMVRNMVDPYSPTSSAYTYLVGNDFRIGYSRSFLRPEKYTLQDLSDPNSPAATRKFILGNALYNSSDGLLKLLHDMAVSKNIDVETYIFDYGTSLHNYTTNRYGFEMTPDRPDYPDSSKYFTTLKYAQEKGYGPFNLKTTDGYNEAVDTVKRKADMAVNENDYNAARPVDFGGATNTGYAILTGLEILNQMKDQGIDKRFFLLLTDGSPNLELSLVSDRNQTVINRADYNRKNNRGYGLSWGTQRDDLAMKYIKDVTASTENNPKGLYEVAMLIGLSGISSEIKRVGVPPDIKNQDVGIPSYSINNYMRQTGNATEAYEAKNSAQLKQAFEKFAHAIGVSMGVFDGPDKMK